MTKKYARSVRRLTKEGKRIAIKVAREFAKKHGYKFASLDKSSFEPYKYIVTVRKKHEDGFIDERYADLVRCPYCNAIQVDFWQYDDPIPEDTLCTICDKSYKVDPF